MMSMKYSVVIEKSSDGYGAYVPDLPGCVAAGDTIEEVKSLIQSAMVMHLRTMRDDGDVIPEPTTIVDYIDVA